MQVTLPFTTWHAEGSILARVNAKNSDVITWKNLILNYVKARNNNIAERYEWKLENFEEKIGSSKLYILIAWDIFVLIIGVLKFARAVISSWCPQLYS